MRSGNQGFKNVEHVKSIVTYSKHSDLMSQLPVFMHFIQHLPTISLTYVYVEVIYFKSGGDVDKFIITSGEYFE